MVNAKMVFQRMEKKYMITQAQKDEIMRRSKQLLKDDIFAAATICNIYYDTDHDSLITASIQKPPYKEKLRLRSYGINKENNVYLEIKKKYKGIVNKRRISLYPDEAAYLLKSGKLLHQKTQIRSEIAYFLQYYQPKPKVFIAYERTAYLGIVDKDLRITFDSHIRRRYDHLDLTTNADGKELLNDDQILMEIKVPGAFPLWLTHILSDMKLYPTSFSKYGSVFVEDTLKDKQLLKSQSFRLSNDLLHETTIQEGAYSCLQAY